MTPRLIFLAGPNGAGKSTFYEAFLQDAALDFVNADRITGTLGISNEEAATVADHLRNELLLAGKSFITETVFSDPAGAKLQFLRDAVDAGYHVTIYFIGLASPALSAARVWQRTQGGGHDVPPDRLQRRYEQSLKNLAVALPFATQVHVFDNSVTGHPFRLVLTAKRGVVSYRAKSFPRWLGPAIRDF